MVVPYREVVGLIVEKLEFEMQKMFAACVVAFSVGVAKLAAFVLLTKLNRNLHLPTSFSTSTKQRQRHRRQQDGRTAGQDNSDGDDDDGVAKARRCV